jgi:uncharacterized repeat protein (TIGR03803 family)
MKPFGTNMLAASALLFMATSAQTVQLEILYAFQVGPESPTASLVQGGDGYFYGTTSGGGIDNAGTVFKVTTNGVLTTLFEFGPPVDNGDGYSTNINGANPQAALALGSDGDFYGTTFEGGSYGYGTLFRVTPNGMLTTLVMFNDTNGANPQARLVLGRDGNFYGTTEWGGGQGYGTLFKVSTDGVLTTLVDFNDTNGANLQTGLTFGRDGSLYGTTSSGGSGGQGTIFKVNANAVLTTLVSFSGSNAAGPSELVLGNDGNFYGTTAAGGNLGLNNGYGLGSVVRMTPAGALTTMFAFNGANGSGPVGALVQGTDGSFYGTTSSGGGSDNGIVFQVTTNGVLTTMVDFNNTNGARPQAGLVLGNDGNLYGTTAEGGRMGFGTVFQVKTNAVMTTLFQFNPALLTTIVLGPGGDFYGTTSGGGRAGNGSVFRMTSSGVLTTLADLERLAGNGSGGYTNGNGAFPNWLLRGGDGNFYGMTSGGGSNGYGTMFQVTTNGLLTPLASFNATNAPPASELVLGSDDAFYGTTAGGASRNGTVFAVTTNGAWVTVAEFNNANGAFPASRLVLGTDGNLYGTTEFNGTEYVGTNLVGLLGGGTVFKIATNGVLTTLARFNQTNGYPVRGLVLGRDGNFYGMTAGFTAGQGIFFQVTTNGTLTTLATLASLDPSMPWAELISGGDGNFYGFLQDKYNLLYGVFQVTTNGTFTWLPTNPPFPRDGHLVLESEGYLYGTGGSTILRLRLGASFTAVAPQSGGGMLLTGSGLANQSYRLWASTNVSLPLVSWTLLTTNFFDGNGNFFYTDTGATTNQSRFYQLSVP